MSFSGRWALLIHEDNPISQFYGISLYSQPQTSAAAEHTEFELE